MTHTLDKYDVSAMFGLTSKARVGVWHNKVWHWCSQSRLSSSLTHANSVAVLAQASTVHAVLLVFYLGFGTMKDDSTAELQVMFLFDM